MKKNIYIVMLFVAVVATIKPVVAQVSTLQMQFENLPQNMSVNPALAPKRAYLSLPLMGSSSFDARTGVSMKDVIYQKNGKNYLDYKTLSGALSGNGDVNMINYNLDILRGGFYVSNFDFIDINVSSRVFVGTDLPEGMLPFLFDNPIENTTDNYNVKMNPNTLAWGELGVGYSRSVNDNFRVGIRAKYLIGFAGVKSTGTEFNIQKDYDKYYMSGTYQMQGGNVNFSNVDFSKSANGVFQNPGFGVDLGAEFVSDDQRIKAIASVSDFGMIFWNDKNSSSIVSKGGNKRFEFTGFGDLNSMVNGGVSFVNLADSVISSFLKTVGSDTISGGFTSYLPTRYHAMVEYSLGEDFQHNVSLSFAGISAFKAGFDYAITAGYTYRSKNGHWQLATNYTYRPNIPFGMGLGGAYTSRRFQIYLGMENIIPIFDLSSVKNFGGRLAINFFFN